MAVRSLKLGNGTLQVPWNALDRAIESVSPAWAGRRLQQRAGHALASLGGYNGASSSRRSLQGWNPLSADADADSLRDLPTLRARSADLERNSPIAGGAVNTTVTHVVGTGLALMCDIDASLLGLSDDAAEAWQQDTERRYNAWAESTDCDITRHGNLYALQGLALRTELLRGDALCVFVQAPARGQAPAALALQLIEGDRLCNPNREPDTATRVAGVDLDAGGAPVAYHVASGHPHRRTGASGITWQRLPAFGARSGRRMVLHLFDRRRPGQTRGVPMLAPVIEPLKQLERYTEAELMAAVISGMFTVFIESEGTTHLQPNALTAGGSTGANAAGSGWDGKLGNGLVVELNKGESISSANPGRPNAQFDPFVTAIVRQVGLLLEIPYEVLVKHYSSSYSAARAALLDAWRYFRTRRERLATQFCQPVYEAWLDREVAAGRISAPGYFADPLIRRAWCAAAWVGDGPGSIDPGKEVAAARDRVDMGISTLNTESLLHDGRPLRPKLRQRKRELQLLRDAGIAVAAQPAAQSFGRPPLPAAPQPGIDPADVDPQDADDDGSTDAPTGAP